MKRNNAGSTLVEIVVAMAILGAFSVSACTSLVLGLRLNDKAESMLQAQLAVSSAVETLMAEGIRRDKATFAESNNNNEEGTPVSIIEESLYAEIPLLSKDGETVKDEDGNPIISVRVKTERERTEDSEFPAYYKVIVTSQMEDVSVTTYIREVAAE